MRACTWRHAQAYVEQPAPHVRVIGLVLGLGLVPVPVCRCRWVVDSRCQGAGARVPVSMARFRCGRFALLLPIYIHIRWHPVIVDFTHELASIGIEDWRPTSKDEE